MSLISMSPARKLFFAKRMARGCTDNLDKYTEEDVKEVKEMAEQIKKEKNL